MDAGVELHGYASDITRAWPVDGRFTSAQRDVYEVLPLPPPSPYSAEKVANRTVHLG